MRKTSLTWVFALAFALSGCPATTTPEGGAEGSGAEADDGAASETANSENAGSTGSLFPDVDASIPTGVFEVVPADVDAILVFDVAGMREFALEFLGLSPDDVLTDATEEQIDSLLAEFDVPPMIAETINFVEVETIAVTGSVSSESAIIITNAEAIANAPEDGAEATQLGMAKVAVRGEWAIVGLGDVFDAAIAADGERFDPAAVWGEGWAAIPENSAYAVFFPDFSVLPPMVLEEMQAETGVAFNKVAFGIALDGTFGVAVDTTPADAPSRALGMMQAVSNMAIEELRRDAPEQARPFIAYLELVGRSLWAQLEFEQTGSTSVISVSEPPCGSAAAYTMALSIAAAFAIEMSDEIDFEVAPAYVPVAQPIADSCARLPGPPASIPRSFAGIAPTTEPGQVIIAMWDTAALARAYLPRMGGVLPFALREQDILNALGQQPLGLASLSDPEGSGAFILREDAETLNEEALLIAHPGVIEFFNEEELGDLQQDATAEVREGVGFIVADEEMLVRLEGERASEGPYVEMVASLPMSAAIAVVSNDVWLSDVRGDLPPGGTADLVNAVRYLALSFDINMVPTLRLRVEGDAAALASAAEADMREQFTASMNELPPEIREQVSTFLGDPTELIVIEARGDDEIGVELRLDTNRGALVTGAIGVSAAIAVPAFLRYVRRSQGMEASLSIRRMYDGAHVYYVADRADVTGRPLPPQFPSSAPLTPPIDVYAASCSGGSRAAAMAPPGAWDAEGWQELDFAIDSPQLYAYQFDSSGTGENATFTATAFGDLDCDGEYSTFQRVGEVDNGEVVGYEGIVIYQELE